MSVEELRFWFFNKMDNCYPVVQCNNFGSIYWFYGSNIVRKKKLFKLNNEAFILSDTVNGKCLFEQDIDNKCLYCDYDDVWMFMKSELHSYGFADIQSIIKRWLKDSELSSYVPLSKQCRMYDFNRTKLSIFNSYNIKSMYDLK